MRGGFAEPAGCALGILRHAVAVAIAQTKIVFGGGVAVRGGAFDPLCGLATTLLQVIAGFVGHPELEGGDVVAVLSGTTRCCDFVTRHVIELVCNLAVSDFEVRGRVTEIRFTLLHGSRNLRRWEDHGGGSDGSLSAG